MEQAVLKHLSAAARSDLAAAACVPFDPSASEAPEPVRQLEAALFEATGGRGLPVLAGFVFGHRRAAEMSVVPSALGEPIAFHPRRATLYLAPSGAVAASGPRARTVAPDACALLERLVITERTSRRGLRLALVGEHGAAIAAAIGCAPSPVLADFWLSGDEGALIEHWAGRTWIACVRRADAERCLASAQERGLAARLDDDDPEPAGATLLAEAASAGPPLYQGKDGALRVAAGAGEQLLQTRASRGAVVEASLSAPGRVLAARPSLPPGSARLAGYLARRHAAQIEALRSAPSLARWLDAKGERGWEAVVAVEETFGGVVSAGEWDGAGAVVFGPWLMVERREEMRAAYRCHSDAAPDNHETLPLVVLGGTRMFHVGLLSPDLDLCADVSGAVFSWEQDFERLRPMACSASVLLERLALVDEMREGWGKGAALVLGADLASELAGSLGAARVPEASDAVAEHHVGERAWVRRTSDAGAARTLVTVPTLGELVQVARDVRARHPDVILDVEASALDGQRRQKALREAGLLGAGAAPPRAG
jgi:hypothetical protein